MSKSLEECYVLCETHFDEENMELYFETKMPDGTILCILKVLHSDDNMLKLVAD